MNSTTFVPNSTGTIRLYASSGGDVDVLNLTVIDPLVANFTYSPNDPNTGDIVTFDGSGSDSSDTNITSYAWIFGDNTTATGETVDHNYTDDGTYNVTLTVTDDEGNTNATSRTISVQNRKPNASFTYSPTNPGTGETVSFDASGSNDSDGSISSYEWDFDGDGTPEATGETVNYTYSDEGNRSVTLTVTDDDGATNTDVTNVTVTGDGPSFSGLAIQDDSWWFFFIDRAILRVNYTVNDPDNRFKNVTMTIENIDTGTVTTRSSNSLSDTLTYGAALGTYGDTYEISVRMYDKNGNVVFEQTFIEPADGTNDNGVII
jgi:PKD repeat protein